METVTPVLEWETEGTKTLAEPSSTNHIKAEDNVRKKLFQGVRNESKPVEGITNHLLENSSLLPKKSAKQLNKHNTWKILDTKYRVKIIRQTIWGRKRTWDWTKFPLLGVVQVQSRELQMTPRNFFGNFQQINKTLKPVQQLKNLRYNKVAGNFFDKPTEGGGKHETKLKSRCWEWVWSSPGNYKKTFHEIFLLISKKLAKLLNQYNKWQISATKKTFKVSSNENGR